MEGYGYELVNLSSEFSREGVSPKLEADNKPGDNMVGFLELFVEVDDFCKMFKAWAASQQLPHTAGGKRGPKAVLSTSEVMTLVIRFHQAGYRNLKHYYLKHVCVYL